MIQRQIEEQKFIMEKISFEKDNVIKEVCNALQRRSSSWEDYITYLHKVNQALLNGLSLRDIIYNYLENNKYLSYGGEENIMPTKSFNLELMEISNLHLCHIEPKVVDVNIIVSNKVVEVTFADGTKVKSVCKEPDTFSLESAISICISKKIMGGSGAYNNAVKRGMKVYQDKLNKEVAEKEEQERIEKKRAKRLAYKERRAVKRAEEESRRKTQEKEEQIEIQKEAYLRAVRELKESENNYIYGE